LKLEAAAKIHRAATHRNPQHGQYLASPQSQITKRYKPQSVQADRQYQV